MATSGIKSMRKGIAYIFEIAIIGILFLMQVACGSGVAYLLLGLTKYSFSYKEIFIVSLIIRMLFLQYDEKKLDKFSEDTFIYILFVTICLIVWAILRLL